MQLEPQEYIIGRYNNTTIETKQPMQIIYPVQNPPLYERRAQLGTLIITPHRMFFIYDKKVLLGFQIHNIYKISTQLEQISTITFNLFTPHSYKITTDLMQATHLLQMIHGVSGPNVLPTSPQIARFRYSPQSYDALMQYECFYQKLQPFQSHIYSQEQPLLKQLARYSVLTPENQIFCGPFSYFDPFREYQRMGVQIRQPTTEQLALMIFGDEIHPMLLKYLLTFKPTYDSQQYTREAQRLNGRVFDQLQLFKSQFTTSSKDMYFDASCSRMYDPRSLFRSDQEFYDLLAKHPQASTASFGLNEFGHNADEGKELIERDEIEEDVEEDESMTENQPAQMNQIANSVMGFFKKVKEATAKKPEPKVEEEVVQDIDFQTDIYCHGCCFKPTYFRVNPVMRQYLLSFIDKKFPEITDELYRPIAYIDFRMSYLNVNYDYSPTYPALICVPDQFADDLLRKSMKFRSRGRIAALSWVNPKSGISISRCSQPGKGFGLTRDSADEILLENIKNSGLGNSQDKFLIVFDARPKLSAIGNRLTGKGFESARAYPFSKTYYCGIDNIHAVRDSYEAMVKLALQFKQGDMKLIRKSDNVEDFGQDGIILETKVNALQKFYEQADKTKWYYHMQTILISANLMAQCVTKLKCNAMVHCSDGWDRTSQLSGLTMLMIDPYYRTLKGFIILIEKEWLSFGHMFATRNRLPGSTKASKRKDSEYFKPQATGKPLDCGQESITELTAQGVNHAPPSQQNYRFSSSQTSQVFFQFLECVYQLLNQMPHEFEFNENFLLFLAKELFDGSSGTFFFDCEEQRTHYLVQMTTKSCYEKAIGNGHYLNPGYILKDTLVQMNNDVGETSLSVRASQADMKVWAEFWLEM
ncbi:Myotubularin-like_protein [Hexamita inflata]|uniref:Myotubularin-like protein n=1 Tax=Hexamita inflata TaxID=28002 RepID=A0AA86PQT3_9EUKA|nr:Myotubularin-like protein [Hexamita inflata]